MAIDEDEKHDHTRNERLHNSFPILPQIKRRYISPVDLLHAALGRNFPIIAKNDYLEFQGLSRQAVKEPFVGDTPIIHFNKPFSSPLFSQQLFS